MDIDQSTLIWITRGAFLVVDVLIAYWVWCFMRKERLVKSPVREPYQLPQHIELPKKRIVLQVMAKPGRVFDNSLLFQVMHELNFAYSETQIFGYMLPKTSAGDDTEELLFRVVNSRQPHIFADSDKNVRPTNGLLVVMDFPVADGDQQVAYFNLLLSIVDEMREKLNAELCDINRSMLKNVALYQMKKEIEQFEQHYQAVIQHDYQRSNA